MTYYDLVILDFDGTVLKTDEAIAYCTLKTIQELFPSSPSGIETLIHHLISTGNTLHDTFQQLGVPPERISESVSIYRDIYACEANGLSSLFDGVLDTLTALAQSATKVALLSNKGDVALQSAVKSFALEPYLDFAVGERDGIKPKPDPSVFHNELLPHFGLKLSDRFLVVGDTAADITFAQAIGADSCWVSYGYGKPEICNALEPTYSVDRMAEVLRIVLGF
jgi:phosphoglycolate phosphatase